MTAISIALSGAALLIAIDSGMAVTALVVGKPARGTNDREMGS